MVSKSASRDESVAASTTVSVPREAPNTGATATSARATCCLCSSLGTIRLSPSNVRMANVVRTTTFPEPPLDAVRFDRLEVLARPHPVRPDSSDTGRRRAPGCLRGRSCRTAHRSGTPAPTSLSRVTPSAASEHFPELLGCPISRSLATSCVRLELRPLPPPALPGFSGTTSLSVTPQRPACPSPASAWSSLTTPRGFPCCARFPCVHAVATTPAQPLAALHRSSVQ